MAEPGWYPDPTQPGFLAYFDGTQWTGERAPMPAPQGQWAGQPQWGQPQWGQPEPPPSSDGRKFTYAGKSITNASEVLTKADGATARYVKSRHGATDADTRCYFTREKKPAEGTGKTDVGDWIECGPVLFVDGTRTEQYLSLALAATPVKSGITLTAAAPAPDARPTAVSSAVELVRTDSAHAPAGAGGLKVPEPPRATKDVVTVASLGPTADPGTLSDARMISKEVGLQVTAAGAVPRYGSGDDARSAPAGEKLMAFQYTQIGGDLDDIGAAKPSLKVSGETALRDVPSVDAGQWVIAAIPTNSTAALSMSADGVTQTLSLPAGNAGTTNLDVLARDNRTTQVSRTASIPVRVSDSTGSGTATIKAALRSADIDYWVPSHPTVHASAPTRAMLSLDLDYSYSDEPSKQYGFPTAVVRLELPDGKVLKARNVATEKNRIYNVFDVPASLTRATLTITGAAKVGSVTFSIRKAVSFAITFTAG